MNDGNVNSPKWLMALEQVADDLITQFDQLHDQLVFMRYQSGLSVGEVAERMACPVEDVERFERYDADPALSMVKRYALALHATISIESKL